MMGRTPRPRLSGSAAMLTPSVLDLLIGGWGAIGTHPDDPDPFAPWALDDAQLDALYRQHARAVEAEARRRGRDRSWFLDNSL